MVGGFIISRFWKALEKVTIPGHSIFSYHEEAKVLFSSGLSCSNVPSLEDEEKKIPKHSKIPHNANSMLFKEKCKH